jgi:hypothetical protein
MENMGRTLIRKDSREKKTKDQEAKLITLLTLKAKEEGTRMKTEVRQKTWNADGKTTTENWSMSSQSY